jgi:hypothetical protein
VLCTAEVGSLCRFVLSKAITASPWRGLLALGDKDARELQVYPGIVLCCVLIRFRSCDSAPVTAQRRVRMFVAIILVCAQMQDLRDCTAETASQVVTLAQAFFTEDECMDRSAQLRPSRLLHEMKPEEKMKVVCEHVPSDK